MTKMFKFWFLLIIQIIAAMAVAFFVSGFVIIQFIRDNIAGSGEPFPWVPAVSFMAAAVTAAGFVIFFISSRFFTPIDHLIDALKEVTAGNFSVSLPETDSNSEINRMNLNFNKMVKELNSMETLQKDFIQNVSHEFKTPLAAIEGYASVLYRSSESEEIREYGRRIMESSRKLSNLTSSILKLSKLENQQIISEKEEFYLDEQIRQAFLSLEPLWRSRDIDIEMNFPEIIYFGNQDLLFQVWTNLFSNAVKFTPDGGKISASIEETEEWIIVQVKDTGIGMEEEVKARIFERFYQGQTDRSGEGNGLGLALVKKIADLCGGTITAQSVLGKGTSFYVKLPKEK